MLILENTTLSVEQKWDLYRKMEGRPLMYFLPNRAQYEMNRAVGNCRQSGNRVFLVTSGNGVGKTSGVVNLISNVVWSNINIFRNILDLDQGEEISGFYDFLFFNQYPTTWPKHIWYVSNKESLKSIWAEFKKWIPTSWMLTSKEGKSNIPVSSIKFVGTKWELQFRTIDQDKETFESANVGVMVFDEPPPREIYHASVSRLRSGGIIIIPATPLFKAGWFVDDIVEKVDQTDPNNDKYHQTVSVWENCIETAGFYDLGGAFGCHPKGNLNRSDVEFTLNNYDPDERPAREWGEFAHLTGLVYKTYKREKHFQPFFDPAFKFEYMYDFVLDPHERRPPAACWIRIDRAGRRKVLREWPSIDDACYSGRMFHQIPDASPYTIEDFVKFWLEIEDQLQIPKNRLRRIIDPNFGKKPSSITGRMLFEDLEMEFAKQGSACDFVTTANDDLYTGHMAVKRLLRQDLDGEPYIMIDPRCRNVDYSFRNYMYDDWEGKAAAKKDLSVKVQEKGKDFCDLIRYHAVLPVFWKEKELEEERRKFDYEYGISNDQTAQRPKGAAGI